MKKIVILISGFILTGCQNFVVSEGHIDTYNCNSGYVKHLKYDNAEIINLKNNQNKKVYYIKNDNNPFEKCDEYPCQICNKFLCKQHNFVEVKIFDEKKGKYFKLDKNKNPSENFFKLFRNKKIETNDDRDYIWNVFVKDNLEYEQLFNSSNNKLVYEIITPYQLKEKVQVTECDVEVYSIYNSFFNKYLR